MRKQGLSKDLQKQIRDRYVLTIFFLLPLVAESTYKYFFLDVSKEK
jgi:hypothetical protein